MAANPVCKYGASCYRKNPDHLKQFSHPGREEAEQGTEDRGGQGEGTGQPARTRSKTPKGKAQPQRRMRPQTKVKNLACTFWPLHIFLRISINNSALPSVWLGWGLGLGLGWYKYHIAYEW